MENLKLIKCTHLLYYILYQAFIVGHVSGLNKKDEKYPIPGSHETQYKKKET